LIEFETWQPQRLDAGGFFSPSSIFSNVNRWGGAEWR
jgi:hypothetical protein